MTTPRIGLAARFDAEGLDWLVPDWPAPANVHGFVTTRTGGVSTGARASFDLGGAASTEADVRENRRRLSAFVPGEPAWLHQVHGATVVEIGSARPALPPHADAAVTREADVVCAVRVADCLPVLLCDADGACVGAAHAGWRGLAAGVLEATVRALHDLGARHVLAWLGPAIGPEAFEVGPEVRAAFCDADPGAAAFFRPGLPAKWLADLYGLARLRLRAAGVSEIRGGGHCTRREEARFFSYRRERDTGRMAALIWRTATQDPSV